MRILLGHNHYRTAGGEDIAFHTDLELLRSRGVLVEPFVTSNSAIQGLAERALAVPRAFRNPAISQALFDMVERFNPDLIHFHNTFPRVSVHTIEGILKMGRPVVLTLHNYRLWCANAQFLRDGAVCELCATRSRLNAVYHRCYRGSAIGSAVVTTVGNRMIGLLSRNRSLMSIIALTDFAKSKAIAGGIDENQIFVRGNSVSDLGVSADRDPQNLVIFVGRLSEEKGVMHLPEIAAHAETGVTVIGSGPAAKHLANASSQVRLIGQLPHDEVRQIIQRARILLVPSLWYEGFPMVIAEAMSSGTVPIASALGAMPSIFVDGVSGIALPPPDPASWGAALKYLLNNKSRLERMGANARAHYLENYTSSRRADELVSIYEHAISRSVGG